MLCLICAWLCVPAADAAPRAKAQLNESDRRAHEVIRKTWKLVQAELGGWMPEVVLIQPGQNVKKPNPDAAMWTDRIRPKELPFEEQLAAWEAAGRPDTWTPLMSPRRDIIYITPGSVRALGSDNPATRRKAQKQLFHEFKHARQSEDVLADEAAREWDASHFAKVHGKRKLRKRSRPAA